MALQGQHARALRATGDAGLQVGMVGGGGPAARPVVEHRQRGVLRQQGQQLAVQGAYTLWLVRGGGQREVLGQDGVGVHQQLYVVRGRAKGGVQRQLLGRAVLSAEEAGALAQRLAGDGGAGRGDAGGVPLCRQRQLAAVQLVRGHVGQLAVALQRGGPQGQLAVQEALQGRALLVRLAVLLAVHALARSYLHGAQPVLVQVVLVHALHAQRSVAVALPPAAQVQLVKDAPYAVAAAEGQPHGVVLAVAGVGQLQLAQQGGEEGARSTQTVDAQRVVRAVLVGPLGVVDQARRQRLELEVAHAVAAHHHGAALLAESIDNALQRLGRRVQVVAVQLYGEAAAARVVHRHVPAPADAQVAPFGPQHHKAPAAVALSLSALVGSGAFPVLVGSGGVFVLVGSGGVFVLVGFVACLVLVGSGGFPPPACLFVQQPFQHLAGTVARVVVHHDDVEGKRRLLREGALHGVPDGAYAVVDGDDDRCLMAEGLLVEVYIGVGAGVYQRADGPQVGRGGLLHLYLYGAVGGVHIVELLDARGAGVGLHHRVEVFVQVEQAAPSAQEQPQVVEAGIFVVLAGGLFGPLSQQVAAQQYQRPEVEVVADGPQLVVNDGVAFLFPLSTFLFPLSTFLFPLSTFLFPLHPVSIHHGGTAVVGGSHQACHGTLDQHQRGGRQHYQHILGTGLSGHAAQHGARCQRAQRFAEEGTHGGLTLQLFYHRLRCRIGAGRQENVYSSVHISAFSCKSTHFFADGDTFSRFFQHNVCRIEGN